MVNLNRYFKSEEYFKSCLRKRIFSCIFSNNKKVELFRALDYLDPKNADYFVTLDPLSPKQRFTKLRKTGRLEEIIPEAELDFMITNKVITINAHYRIVLNLAFEPVVVHPAYWIEFVRNGSHIMA